MKDWKLTLKLSTTSCRCRRRVWFVRVALSHVQWRTLWITTSTHNTQHHQHHYALIVYVYMVVSSFFFGSGIAVSMVMKYADNIVKVTRVYDCILRYFCRWYLHASVEFKTSMSLIKSMGFLIIGIVNMMKHAISKITFLLVVSGF